jgi:hypothetical protein
MDIDPCINKYLDLSSAVFQPKRAKGNIYGRVKDFLKADGAYSSDHLESEVRAIAESQTGNAEAKLMDPDAPCKT